MPRQARKLSGSGIYHVMQRGIDRQTIFAEPQDYTVFLKILQECRALCGFKLYAYCLMGNHVHLLLKVENDPLEAIFKRICGQYASWYNAKYDRVGHLFQDRFRSEPVENDEFFLTVLRYIHQNPVKAGLCGKPEDYRYSSYSEYLSGSDAIDSAFVLDMLPLEEFVRFNHAPNDDECLEVSTGKRRALTDDQVQELFFRDFRVRTAEEFLGLDEERKCGAIRMAHHQGASVRQLSRLTGLGKGWIEKWLKGH